MSKMGFGQSFYMIYSVNHVICQVIYTQKGHLNDFSCAFSIVFSCLFYSHMNPGATRDPETVNENV